MIQVIARYFDETGQTGLTSFPVDTLEAILPRLVERPIGTVRITLDIALPSVAYPCTWTSELKAPCGAPSVITRELAVVIGTGVGAWREKDLCADHYQRVLDFQRQGTLRVRAPYAAPRAPER